MFTGIVEEIGKILSITDKKITIKADVVLNETKLGDSISVNGICLTVTKILSQSFEADISPETYNVTALKYLKTGDYINLERAMSINGRFGGHIVLGHIDGIGKIISIKRNNEFYDLEVQPNEKELKYIVQKGSITINGISLTVAQICGKTVKIAIIPHTYDNTSLCKIKQGDYVNIETDIISKYVEKFLSTSDNKTGINMEFLLENGF